MSELAIVITKLIMCGRYKVAQSFCNNGVCRKSDAARIIGGDIIEAVHCKGVYRPRLHVLGDLLYLGRDKGPVTFQFIGIGFIIAFLARHYK